MAGADAPRVPPTRRFPSNSASSGDCSGAVRCRAGSSDTSRVSHESAKDWNLSIHDRQEITDLAAHYSGYPFASYPKHSACNVCRLMLLHRYGGVYSDLNVEPCRILEDFLRPLSPSQRHFGSGSLPVAPWKRAASAGRWRSARECPRSAAGLPISSWPRFPVTRSGWRLWNWPVQEPVSMRNQYDILYTTGPNIVTETLQRNAHRFPDVAVVPPHVLRQFITHHCAGSWRTPDFHAFGRFAAVTMANVGVMTPVYNRSNRAGGAGQRHRADRSAAVAGGRGQRIDRRHRLGRRAIDGSETH